MKWELRFSLAMIGRDNSIEIQDIPDRFGEHFKYDDRKNCSLSWTTFIPICPCQDPDT